MRALVSLAILLLAAQLAGAADVSVTLPPGVVIPEAAQPGPNFDAETATAAYLALLTPEQRARSDAYFEGGYWLQLWNWLLATAISFLILLAGWGVRIRDGIARRFKKIGTQTYGFAVVFVLLTWALSLPLSIYEGFFREHHYGSSNETFGAWFVDELKALALILIFVPFFIAGIYSFMRRLPRTWWAWSVLVSFGFFVLIVMITPVFINPLFNDYKPLAASETRAAILSMARANQVPAHDVMWYDASKQTKRISAHVAGLFGTTQVGLNDNLLEKTSLPEIKAVMAHELGHFVLNHGLRHTIYLTLLFGVGFFVLHRGLNYSVARWGERWQIRDPADPATLPLASAILGTYLFLVDPLENQIIYSGEVEADLYGLNAAREPHGFATVAMRLASYRKLEPGPIEKFFFYDHPSGRDRVEMSMQWLKENQELFEAMNQ